MILALTANRPAAGKAMGAALLAIRAAVEHGPASAGGAAKVGAAAKEGLDHAHALSTGAVMPGAFAEWAERVHAILDNISQAEMVGRRAGDATPTGAEMVAPNLKAAVRAAMPGKSASEVTAAYQWLSDSNTSLVTAERMTAGGVTKYAVEQVRKLLPNRFTS